MNGESAVASVAISVAAILLSGMAALAWWTTQTQRAFLEAGRTEQVRAVGSLLAESAEPLLAGNELSADRRMVAEAARDHNLSACRIVLPAGVVPGGEVLADANPSLINVQKLPATWAGVPAAPQARAETGAVAVSYPLNIPGRGLARLEISAGFNDPFAIYWQTLAGLGVIGSASLSALLILYRRLRRRLIAFGAVRESLLAMAAGESDAAALAVDRELGPEARAWNEMLTDREKMRRQSIAERAKEVLGARRSAKGDLDIVFDAMSQGLLLVDDKMSVKQANGAAAVFLQAKRDKIQGAALATVIQQAEVLEAVRAVIAGSLRRKTTIEVEQTSQVPVEPGAVPPQDPGNPTSPGVLRFTIRPVRRDDSASAMILIEDITQQRVAEESRNAFVAQATHELRTPLTNIRLYVETAIDEGDKDPALRGKCLNVINHETRRLERIVGEMLSVAEIEAGSIQIKRDDIRLDALFEELKADYASQAADKSIALNFDLPPKLPVIQGDRDKLNLALHNLLGNALKYTPDGGEVTLSVEATDKQLVVSVRDTGIGISPDDADRIFDRFYRAKDPRVSKVTGSGLGLTLAREVVRLHGGDITVQSQLDKGSTFTLTVPTVAEAA